uniref:Uncharacterized protein n=1 Tax=Neospora caninum (strain Liverpool) TaxID=572307 RepID=A0A0F7U4J0_NEOCL|nr:TPA: hypothetical protein BN1204_005545 [Neospora caninum Liverpool]
MNPFSSTSLFSSAFQLSAPVRSLAVLSRRGKHSMSTVSPNVFSLFSASRASPPPASQTCELLRAALPFISHSSFSSSCLCEGSSLLPSNAHFFSCGSTDPPGSLRGFAACIKPSPGGCHATVRVGGVKRTPEEEEKTEETLRTVQADAAALQREMEGHRGDAAGGCRVKNPVQLGGSAATKASLGEGDTRVEEDAEIGLWFQEASSEGAAQGGEREVEATKAHAVRSAASSRPANIPRERSLARDDALAACLQVDVLLSLLQRHTRETNEREKREPCREPTLGTNASATGLDWKLHTPHCGAAELPAPPSSLAVSSSPSSLAFSYAVPSPLTSQSSLSFSASAPAAASPLVSPVSSSPSPSSVSLPDSSAEASLSPSFLLQVMHALAARSSSLSLSQLLRLAWSLASLRLENVASPAVSARAPSSSSFLSPSSSRATLSSPACSLSSSPVPPPALGSTGASSAWLPLLWGARRRLIDSLFRRLHSAAWPVVAPSSPSSLASPATPSPPSRGPGLSRSSPYRSSPSPLVSSSPSASPTPPASSLARGISAISTLLDPRAKERFPLVLSLILPRLFRLFASQIDTEYDSLRRPSQWASPGQPPAPLFAASLSPSPSSSSPASLSSSSSPSPCPPPSSLSAPSPGDFHSHSRPSLPFVSATSPACEKNQVLPSVAPILSSLPSPQAGEASPSALASPARGHSPLQETKNYLASPTPREASSFLFALVLGGCARLNLRPPLELLEAFNRICLLSVCEASVTSFRFSSSSSSAFPFPASDLSSADSTRLPVSSRSSSDSADSAAPPWPPALADSIRCAESPPPIRDISLLLLSLSRVEATADSSRLLHASTPLLSAYLRSLVSPDSEHPPRYLLPASAASVSPPRKDTGAGAASLNLANLLTASALHAQMACEVDRAASGRGTRRSAPFPREDPPELHAPDSSSACLSPPSVLGFSSIPSASSSSTPSLCPCARSPSPYSSSDPLPSAALWRRVAVGCLHACAALARNSRKRQGDQGWQSATATPRPSEARVASDGRETAALASPQSAGLEECVAPLGSREQGYAPSESSAERLVTSGPTPGGSDQAPAASSCASGFPRRSLFAAPCACDSPGAEDGPLAASLERQVTLCCLAFSPSPDEGAERQRRRGRAWRRPGSRWFHRLTFVSRARRGSERTARRFSALESIATGVPERPRKGEKKERRHACTKQQVRVRSSVFSGLLHAEETGTGVGNGVWVRRPDGKKGSAGRVRQRVKYASGKGYGRRQREANRETIHPLLSACSTDTLVWLVGLLRTHYAGAGEGTRGTHRGKADALPGKKGTPRDGRGRSPNSEEEQEKGERDDEPKQSDVLPQSSEGLTASGGGTAGDTWQRQTRVFHTLDGILPALHLTLRQSPNVSAASPFPPSPVSVGAQRGRRGLYGARHAAACVFPCLAYEVVCNASAYPYTVDILLREKMRDESGTSARRGESAAVRSRVGSRQEATSCRKGNVT